MRKLVSKIRHVLGGLMKKSKPAEAKPVLKKTEFVPARGAAPAPARSGGRPPPRGDRPPSRGPRREGPQRETPRRDPRGHDTIRPRFEKAAPDGETWTLGSEQPAAPARPKAAAPPRRPVEKPAAPAAPWDPAAFQVPPAEGKVRFQDLDLPEPVMHAIHDLGFKYCTPIQGQILPLTLAGRDATGRAQTGTGKTAAFLITILTRFLRGGPRRSSLQSARALVLVPTRELAVQVEREAKTLGLYTDFGVTAVYGGTRFERQIEAVRGGRTEIIVATPGRLLDMVGRGMLSIKEVEVLVIDEADRMLDMGFIPDVRRIVRQTPPREQRQTLLFSATLTPDVVRLAGQWMNNAATVEIEPEQVAVDTVEQIVYIVTRRQKLALLYNILLREKPERVLIFANRRDSVDHLFVQLQRMGLSCAQISGALPQNARERTLEAFREGKIHVLVATDVAGRGLHIEGVSHVINYNFPQDAEDYVHRIGRTGRAGKKGVSISFACDDDSYYIPDVEKYIGRTLPCTQPDESWLVMPHATRRPPSA